MEEDILNYSPILSCFVGHSVRGEKCLYGFGKLKSLTQVHAAKSWTYIVSYLGEGGGGGSHAHSQNIMY